MYEKVIDVAKVHIGVYMLSGVLSAFAGILSIARFNTAPIPWA